MLLIAVGPALHYNSILNLYEMIRNEHFEVIIIGGSFAGLATAMALGRALREVMVIDSENPCNKQTPHSHNFLTQDGKPPKEIKTLAMQQLAKYDTIKFYNSLVTAARKTENRFEVATSSGKIFTAAKLVFATGITDIQPDIAGFSECWGISVLHCPYCHGYEVKNETTGVLGNGEYGFEFSKLISNWTKDLTLFTNGKSHLTTEQINVINKHHIEIIEKEISAAEHRNGYVQNIVFKDGTKKEVKAIYTRLPFKQHCSIPEQLGCELTEEGYIKIDHSNKTNIKGIFACGDNTTRMRTVANAVSMGTTTGMLLNKELVEEHF